MLAPLPAPFAWEGDHLAIALPGGRAVFTTRRGGVSAGAYASLNFGGNTDDDPDAVAENRRRVAALAGVTPDKLLYGWQVHGAGVRRAAGPRAGPVVEQDGQATARRGLVALARTADCLPIALIAPEAVAMLHGGWRGLAAGIVAEGVAALRELGARDGIAAAIGPGAGGCCYEVGDEVHAALPGHRAGSGRLLDLHGAAHERLEAAGVEEVHDCGLCTMCAAPELFFSHRRDRGVTGRQVGLAWRV